MSQHPGMPTMGAYVGKTLTVLPMRGHIHGTNQKESKGINPGAKDKTADNTNRYLRCHSGVRLLMSLLGPLKRFLGADELTFMVSNRLFKILSICASTFQELFCFSSLAALSSKLSCTAPAVENLRSCCSTTCADFSSQILPIAGFLFDLFDMVVAGV